MSHLSGRLKEMKEEDIIREYTSIRDFLEDKVEGTRQEIDKRREKLTHIINHLEEINKSPYLNDPGHVAQKNKVEEKYMKYKQELERSIAEWENRLVKYQEILEVSGNRNNTTTEDKFNSLGRNQKTNSRINPYIC